jgi:hypothetical protein
MAVTEEQVLPTFNQTQLAEAAAQTLILSGKLICNKAAPLTPRVVILIASR